MAQQSQTELSPPPSDVISALEFAPSSTRLLVASWDRHVYLYDTAEEGESGGGGGRLLRTYEHRAPVLDVCFGSGEEGEEGEEEDVAYSGGLDWDVRR